MSFENVYENSRRAEAYAKLEFANTYYLAYRDLPMIIQKHVEGNRAVDFGCGAGRSTRFLKQRGFHVIGIDIAQDMLNKARELDPTGDYRLVSDGGYRHLGTGTFDLVQSIFTFDNIPGKENRIAILKSLRELLEPEGKMICLGSNSEVYTNEWASFTTKDFRENRHAKTGDIVRIITTDVEDRRPVEDIFWTEDDYQEIFAAAGFDIEEIYRPLGQDNEPYRWVSETTIPPWIIYVLRNTK
ncbi:MAG TPA: class I SAM-dependent methyltransferase [Bacteroidota bacterium]